jgi:ribosomal protein L33
MIILTKKKFSKKGNKHIVFSTLLFRRSQPSLLIVIKYCSPFSLVYGMSASRCLCMYSYYLSDYSYTLEMSTRLYILRVLMF